MVTASFASATQAMTAVQHFTFLADLQLEDWSLPLNPCARHRNTLRAILTIPLAEYFDPFGETATVHNNLRSAHNTMEQLDCVFLRLTDFARTVLKGEM
jgi:hypothetical protein